MQQYVILFHELPPDSSRESHWDLMLQTGNCLCTWALARPPASGAEIEAQKLPDHRMQYLDYEGPVSGGRGSVSPWDRGNYELLKQSEMRWEIALHGRRLNGVAVLRCEDDQRWTFRFTGKIAAT